MLLSHSKQFIYLKTGKTASTSVEIFFQPYCLPNDHPCHHSPTHSMDETISKEGIVAYRGPTPPSQVTFYNHMPASLVKNLVGDETWDNYFKFCVIRNPFDKLVSFWWFHLSQRKKIILSEKNFLYVKKQFKHWVLTNPLSFIDNYIYKINDSVCVDHFIRFENLQNDIQYIIEKLSLSLNILTLKRYKSESRKKDNHFSEYYDNETITIVKNLFPWELDYFNYTHRE